MFVYIDDSAFESYLRALVRHFDYPAKTKTT